MFEVLSDKLDGVLRKLRVRGKLTESDIRNAMREIRMVLLEADVNFKVARQFINAVQEKSMGREVMKSITPGQQVVKIVHEELTRILGGTASEIVISDKPPTKILIVGLQGSGKTTLAVKLAYRLKSQGKNPMLVAADIHRPAAVSQLEIMAGTARIPVYSESAGATAEKITKNALDAASRQGADVIVIDTAGRLHVDEEMMKEVEGVRKAASPHEVLFVADSMIGQDAVNAAAEFNKRLEVTGIVVTKLDGDARGGSALSIRAVTGKPIKLAGIGEKVDDLEVFHPERMASRILGMGDIVTLVEKAQQVVDIEEAKKLEQKLRKQAFTFDDFLSQLRQLRKMGPLDGLLDMIPGVGKKMKGLKVDESELSRIEAIICSMTPGERMNPRIIDGSRRKRIARGSGVRIQEVNALVKQFEQVRKMLRMFNTKKGKQMNIPGFKGLGIM